MIEYLFTSPVFFLIWIAALLIAIAVHEFAHALAADRLGDPTPKLQGRLTLNPIAHLDPLGTLMILLFRFGWGKPVRIDPFNLKDPRRDQALIALAGPGSSLLTAVLLALVLRILIQFAPFNPSFFYTLFSPFIVLNVGLGIFNLLPIHPLDGGKILVGLLPKESALQVDEFLGQYGIIILLLLVFPFFGTSLLTQIIVSPIGFLLNFLLPAFPFS